MRALARFTGLILTLASLWRPHAAQTTTAISIDQFLQLKENNALMIAGNATLNERNCGVLRSCQANLSTLACTAVSPADLTCTATPANANLVCGLSNCTDRLLSYLYSAVRLPGSSVQQTGAQPGLVDAVAQDLIKRDVCVQQPLESVFQYIVPPNSVSFLDWAYYGSVRGVMRIYPFAVYDQVPPDKSGGVISSSNDIQCSPFYDPRRRSWFTGASSQSKTLIVLIDTGATSGVAGKFVLAPSLTPLTLAKTTAVTLLDTLRPLDYVAVYGFTNTSTLLGYTQVLSYDVPRNETGVNALNLSISQLAASNDSTAKSNLTAALSSAVKLFQTNPTGGANDACEKVVVVLTDGASLAPVDSSAISTIAGAGGATVFFFSVGDAGKSQNDRSLQTASCATGGIWGRLDNYQDPLLSLYPYFNYLAFRSPYRFTNTAKRSQPYTSFSLNRVIVTHSKPVYDPAGNFMGVAADDFPIDYGFALNYGTGAVYQALVALGSEACNTTQPGFCDLQLIRNSTAFACPTDGTPATACTLPAASCPASANSASVVFRTPGVLKSSAPLTCCKSCLLNTSAVSPVGVPAPALAPAPSGGGSGGTSVGLIAGVVGGVGAAALLALGIVLWCCYCRTPRNREDDAGRLPSPPRWEGDDG